MGTAQVLIDSAQAHRHKPTLHRQEPGDHTLAPAPRGEETRSPVTVSVSSRFPWASRAVEPRSLPLPRPHARDLPAAQRVPPGCTDHGGARGPGGASGTGQTPRPRPRPARPRLPRPPAPALARPPGSRRRRRRGRRGSGTRGRPGAAQPRGRR